MKIDAVLTACNMNTYFLNLYPYVYKIWKERFNLELYLVLIADTIPDNLKIYEKNIYLFKPIVGVNTCYQAQTIRILYPCIFNNLNILTTDVDIIPISFEYFFDSIKNYSDNVFISYTDRYIDKNMLAICYNLANSTTWKNIFNINCVDDIIKILKENYNPEYTGTKNCQGWYTDQKLLYEYVLKYKQNNLSNVIILTDTQTGYKRLDGKGSKRLNDIITNKDNILKNIHTYSDFHIIRNYQNNIKLLNSIIDAILNGNIS